MGNKLECVTVEVVDIYVITDICGRTAGWL